MKYLVVEIETNTIGSELVSNIIQEQGSDVSIFDRNDFINLINQKEVSVIWDYYDNELDNISDIAICRGYFDVKNKEEVSKNIKNELKFLKENSPFDLGELKVNFFEQEELQWLDVWKKFYKPIEIKNFIIKPIWENIPNSKDKTIIEINPGMAFGTGDHKSTQLILSMIDDIDLKNKKSLDMGTGSGILGIALAKRGVSICKMYDIDKDAIKNCIENIKLNNVEKNTIAEVKSDLKDEKEPFDIITANITADILIMLKNDFIRLLNKDAYLALSGIIREREEDVKKAFNIDSLELVKQEGNETWTALLYKKI